MCMIAFRPLHKGKGPGNMPATVIETAMNRHPDGFGVAYRQDGRLHVERFGPHARKQFRKALKRIDRQRVEYVAHFRFATHGPKAESHSHPYEYVDPTEGRVLVFHNGVIDIRTTATESDTQVFVRDVLAALPSAWWRSPALRFLVGQSIGWSRLVVMTAHETVNLQERDGEWDGGLWYSSNHKPITHKAPVTAGKGSWLPAPDRVTFTPKPSGGTLIGLPSATAQYRHLGHPLTVVKPFDKAKDGSASKAVRCVPCKTVGDVYTQDGEVYFDLTHKVALIEDGALVAEGLPA